MKYKMILAKNLWKIKINKIKLYIINILLPFFWSNINIFKITMTKNKSTFMLNNKTIKISKPKYF